MKQFLSYLLPTGGCVVLLSSIAGMAEDFSVVERGLDHAVVESVRLEEAPGGQRTITNRYTTLASGMHRVVNGEYVPASAVIELRENGAIAEQARHTVAFSANANDWNGAVTIVTPDGKTLRSRVLGISYLDLSTGQSAMIAELKDSEGVLFAEDNAVVYADCMTDFACDLEYENRIGGFEQNLVFQERPPAPSQYGLNDATTVVQLLTEFFEPPAPARTSVAKNGQTIDRVLDFGAMKIGMGKSFMAQNRSKAVSVDKQWTRLDDEEQNPRDFLIEQVAYAKIEPFLLTLPLPPQAAKAKPDAIKRIAGKKRWLPSRKVAAARTSNPIQVAAAPRERKGFVLDYSILTGNLTNYVFKCDSTYVITNLVSLYGTTTCEGGTVLKYRQSGVLGIYGTLVCKTDSYRPAVFTTWQDDSVGEIVAGSTNNPVNFGEAAIRMYASGEIKHLRISYATQAIEFNFADHTLSHCQFLKCNTGLFSYGGSLRLRNNLFYRCDSALAGFSTTIVGEHLTVNQSVNLIDDFSSMALRLTNSILVAVTNIETSNINATNSNFIWLTNDPGVFQTVGSAAHYLINGSPYRNAGTGNITASLLTDLRKKTTYPPVVLSNSTLTNSLTLVTQAQRDIDDYPDLGYHYDPLDYAIGNVIMSSNASLTIQPGTAIAFFQPTNNGFALGAASGTLTVTGSPTNLVQFARYNAVQEQANTNWSHRAPSIISPWFTGWSTPTWNLRFVDWSILANDTQHIYGYGAVNTEVVVRDCQFHGGSIYANGDSLSITNCLFERVASWVDYGSNLFYLNNTFYGGSLELGFREGTWTLRNNIFDQVQPVQYEDLTNSHNAYSTNLTRLTPNSTNDIVTNIVYESGTLGSYYLPANSALTNKGHAAADSLGFFHHTTATNQIKEGTTTIDIGFHYIAVTNGVLFDSDNDGLPDYGEDRNGNGISDDGETDWLNADPDNDGISDLWEIVFGTNPAFNEPASNSGRRNYTYRADGNLQTVLGINGESIAPDAEGNLLQVQP